MIRAAAPRRADDAAPPPPTRPLPHPAIDRLMHELVLAGLAEARAPAPMYPRRRRPGEML